MPVIKKPSEHFDVSLWTGDGTTSPRSITNAGGFQPNLVWSKDRTSAYNHQLFDSVRGTGSSKNLMSNDTDAEGTNASSFGYLSAFNSNGFALTKGTDPGNEYLWVGKTSDNYVAWQWKAGGAAVANTSGSISSQVSVNSTAGFSVVTYTSPNTLVDETVGHGLGAVPQFIITKNRDAAFNWDIWHKDLSSGYGLVFESGAQSSGRWPTTTPTSSVFSVKYNYEHVSTNKYVAYCWTPIAGYSAFGTYTGNGSSNGPFVYLGFRPKFVLVKNISDASTNWIISDGVRSAYNDSASEALYGNTGDYESYLGGTSENVIDFLSNGFKVRSSNGSCNASTKTIIYMAFAEAPFKYASAR